MYSACPKIGLLSLTSKTVIGTYVTVERAESLAVILMLYLSVVSRSNEFLMDKTAEKKRKGLFANEVLVLLLYNSFLITKQSVKIKRKTA